MHTSENILVITSFIFLTLVAILVNIQRPMFNFKAWYFGEGRRFDKSRFPKYIATIAGVGILSIIYGYIVSKSLSLALQFTGINVAIIVIAGITLILYRNKDK